MAMACIVVQLLVVEFQFNKCFDSEWVDHLTASKFSMLATNNIADALILLLPFVLLPPRWRKWSWVVIWLVTLWGVAQQLYIPTYRDLMPFSSFLLMENVGGTLLKSIAGAIRPALIKEILPPVLLYIVYRLWLKRGIEQEQQPASRRWLLAALSIVAFVIIRLTITWVHYRADSDTQTYKDQLTYDYCVMWTRQGDYLNSSGAVPYCIYSIANALHSHTTLNTDERQEVQRFIDEQPHYTDNDFATARGKNVIVLVVESLNSWVIDLRINGREVTPTLNALCHDTINNIVSLKMKPQVKNGRSSDGIFTYNTGLLPLTVQAVTNTHPSAHYPTLPHALGGYDSFYACCDEPALWNVKNMVARYGYSRYFGKENIKAAIDTNGYLLDKALLDNVALMLPQCKQPFLGFLATAGMHHPYNTEFEPTTWVQSTGAFTYEVRCYLERAWVFDCALNDFINTLKKQELYSSTMIVIVSDHNELIDDDLTHGRPTIDQEGDNCVMIILNSGQSGYIEGPFGQIDIYPTLLDLLGLNSQRWKGLGYSLLRERVSSVATAPGTTMGSSSLTTRQQQAWHISEMMITSHWFDPKE